MKIVIVGGGTAGWLSAYYIQQSLKDNVSITVIESSKLGIIGVGEGGTHMLGSFINNKDIEVDFDIKDFIIETSAAYKHGFKHVNWTNKQGHYFNPLDMNISKNSNIDLFLARQILRGEPIHIISDLGLLIEQQKTVIFKDETGFAPIDGYSYHFDGTKVGQFFKKRTNAKLIDSVVKNVSLDEIGQIKDLLLEDGQIVLGDLYIDCTGFSKVLMKSLNTKWVDYKNLLVNSALPYTLPCVPPVEILPHSTSTTLSSGWVWNIPISDRFGCGYVFNEDFISFEQAQQEVEELVGHSINPIKKIKFQSGRYEKTWIKNCVSLGLASAFVEPLEATSIHATTYQIQQLVSVLIKKINVDTFNTNVNGMYDEIKEFIALHYMGGKDTSDFWNVVAEETSTDFTKNIIEISKHRFLKETDIVNNHNSISYRAWNQVLAGLGFFTKDVATQYLRHDTEGQYTAWKLSMLALFDKCKSINDVLENGKFVGFNLR
jgi:tryptophan halogenase